MLFFTVQRRLPSDVMEQVAVADENRQIFGVEEVVDEPINGLLVVEHHEEGGQLLQVATPEELSDEAEG